MIQFIFGEDTFRSKARLSDLINQAADRQAEVVRLIGGDLTPASLDRHLASVSLLNPDRLIVLENVLGETELKDYLLKLLTQPLPAGVDLVFYEAGSPDKRLSLFKALAKQVQAEHFELLSGSELPRAIIELARQRQLELEPMVVQRLAALIGNDLWRMDQELAKLAAYATTAPITTEVVDQLVTHNLTDDVFGLLEAISRRQPAIAQGRLADLVQRGEDPIGVLAVLAWQLRNLIRIADLARRGQSAATITKTTGLHPYAVSVSLRQLDRLSSRWLTTAYQLVIKLDWRIKQGDIAGSDAADWLVATLSA